MATMSHISTLRTGTFRSVSRPLLGVAVLLVAYPLLALAEETKRPTQGFLFKKILATSKPANATPLGDSNVASDAIPWRRTAQGWESTTDWNLDADRGSCEWAAAIHPAVIASLTILVSFAALCGISGQSVT
jgi:hypothetical protein